MRASFSDFEYATGKTVARRARHRIEISAVMPPALMTELEANGLTAEGRSRSPMGTGWILRTGGVQHCLGFSEESIEDSICGSHANSGCLGLDQSQALALDAVAPFRFSRSCQAYRLARHLFVVADTQRVIHAPVLKEGRALDATISVAASSAQNRQDECVPRTRRVRKGDQRHPGMRVHVGVGAATGCFRRLPSNPVDVQDVIQVRVVPFGSKRTRRPASKRGMRIQSRRKIGLSVAASNDQIAAQLVQFMFF